MQSNNFFKKLKCLIIGHDWSYTLPGEGSVDTYRTCKRCGKIDYRINLLTPQPIQMDPFKDAHGKIFPIAPIELEVGENDVLIMSTPDPISCETAERIESEWRSLIEQKKKVFLISGNFHFTVIKGIQKQTTEKKD